MNWKDTPQLTRYGFISSCILLLWTLALIIAEDVWFAFFQYVALDLAFLAKFILLSMYAFSSIVLLVEAVRSKNTVALAGLAILALTIVVSIVVLLPSMLAVMTAAYT